MFEQEAEKYATVDLPDGYTKIDYARKKHWEDGVRFGYNKANVWYYPSRNECPKDEFPDEYTKHRLPSAYKRHYCLDLGDNECVMGKYIRGKFLTVAGQYSLSEIVAWKEIILPEGIGA